MGIYTFSAAHRVGKNGIVYAIEPCSESIDLLQETCRIDEFNNVQVFKNAISDRNGNAHLILQTSSELNHPQILPMSQQLKQKQLSA